MAIKSIPTVTGPTYGGTIYGLKFESNFSSAPSKVTLDIISSNGVYGPVNLNTPATVTFGGFKFNGIVWKYSFDTSAEQRTLQVEIVDQSIILDRYYVLLWKRNFFNQPGKKKPIKQTFDLTAEKDLIPKTDNKNQIYFEEKDLGIEYLTKDIFYYFGIHNQVILIGQEKFPMNPCEIPTTYYTLKDLNDQLSLLRIGTIPFTAPEGYNVSHQGTLREVISAWCQDFGYDFYWDYTQTSQQLMFYNSAVGIQVPSIPDTSNIISKSESQSLEGTYAQHSIGYTAMPRQEPLFQQKSKEFATQFSIYPLSPKFFLNKTLKENELLYGADIIPGEKWGKRTRDDFLQAAFLGYINPSLRSIYLFSLLIRNEKKTEGAHDPLGLNINYRYYDDEDKKVIIDYLIKRFPDDMQKKIDFDEKNLPNFNIIAAHRDQTKATLWYDFEQTILKYHGLYYTQPLENSTYFICQPTYILEINQTVSPEPLEVEPNAKDFKGRRVFQRPGGVFSHSQDSASELLGLNEDKIAELITSLEAYEIDLTYETELESETEIDILDNEKKPFSKLFIFPKVELIEKKLGLELKIGKGLNDAETTVFENSSSQKKDMSLKYQCDKYEKEKQVNSCVNAKDEARNNAKKKLITEEPDPLILREGLSSKNAVMCDIKVDDKKLKLYAPSDAPYKCILSTVVNFERVKEADYEKSFNITNIASDISTVAKLDVLEENFTDILVDEFGIKRKTPIPVANAITQNSPQNNITVTYAGEPSIKNLSPANGLVGMDLSYSSEGFTSKLEFSSRPKKRTVIENFKRKVESQLNRESFRAA